MKANKVSKTFLWMFTILLTGLLLILYFNTATTFDEKYTLLLISHKFSSLISLDSLDVHPPLYYLILRYFLIATTFWTKSLFIKILFAKSLSFIFGIITFVYICKILKLYGLKINQLLLWIVYITLPNVLGSFNPYSTEPIVDIRMYAMGAMLVIIEFYYLSKFSLTRKKEIIFITILLTLSMYTHYFVAIISVMMILSFALRYLSLKKMRNVLMLIISFFVSLILYIPWLPFLYRQLSVPAKRTYNISKLGAIKGIVEFIIMCLIFVLPIIWAHFNCSRRINILSKLIISTLIFTIIFVGFMSLIRPVFNYRYMYPIFLLYEMYSLNILFNNMKNTHKYAYKFYTWVFVLLLFFNFVGSSAYQIFNVDIPSNHIYKVVKNVRNTSRRYNANSRFSRIQNNPNFYGKNYQYDIDGNPINFEYAFDLSYYGKIINTKDISNYFAIKTKPAYKPLFKPVYSHIEEGAY